MPLLLDLFCGAGGAAVGYNRAGWEVVGVDIKKQPHYPYEFHQGDALAWPLGGYDAIHASPPCQRYSRGTPGPARGRHPDLLAAVRQRLAKAGVVWVIENVPGAPMTPHVVCCGCQFGLPHLRRERWFESPAISWQMRPAHRHNELCYPVVRRMSTPSTLRRRLGRNVLLGELKSAMGIDWMTSRELGEAIPPAYSEYVGMLLLDAYRRGTSHPATPK